MSFYDAIRVGASGAADFEVKRSLRFNSGDSAYLQNTPSSAGNRKTNTLSFWVKLGKSGISDSGTVASCNSSNSNTNNISVVIRDDGEIRIVGYYHNFRITNRLLRDPSAWYHIVLVIDSDQGSSTNRVKIYINNVQQSVVYHNTPTSGFETWINSTQTLYLGAAADENGGNMYLAEINFIDGQAYDPSYFGETNSDTGQWVPIEYTGSYTGNSFHLKFDDNSNTTATTLGKDSSGLGNNWTPNNFSVAAGVGNDSLEDSPTNNFCTLNPLSLIGTGGTISNGNLDFTGDSNYSTRAANFSLKTGKWYWEGTPTSVPSPSAPQAFGIVRGTNISSNSYIGYDPNGNVAGFGYFDAGSIKGAAGVGSTSGANLATGQTTYTQNDVVGLASDIANGTLAFYKNGTLVYTITGISSFDWFPAQTTYSTGGKNSVNFGQRPFAHTPPTGHQALCSANLPDPTILLPNKHFNTLIWDGNSTQDRDISGLDFQPDWVWIKARNGGTYGGGLYYHHVVWDSLRGVGSNTIGSASRKELTVNEAYVEGRGANYTDYYGHVSAFNSDGFELDHVTGEPPLYVNRNTNTYVGWSWNAGETDGATYRVVVVSDSGNKYRFRNSANTATFAQSAVTLDLAEGGTYIFNMDDSTNASHPFSIGTAANGTVYTTGITYFLDGVSKTYSEYTSGFAAATTRRLHITVPASAPQLYYWCSIHSGMGGAINTNTTLGSSNFDGTVQSTAKVNASAGFSIVTLNGTGSVLSFGHGLGVKPNAVILKARNIANNWLVFHQGYGATKTLFLDTTGATSTNSAWYNAVSYTHLTLPTSDLV